MKRNWAVDVIERWDGGPTESGYRTGHQRYTLRVRGSSAQDVRMRVRRNPIWGPYVFIVRARPIIRSTENQIPLGSTSRKARSVLRGER